MKVPIYASICLVIGLSLIHSPAQALETARGTEFSIYASPVGIVAELESTSIYDSKIMLPINIAFDSQENGVVFRFKDETGRMYKLCSNINHARLPEPATLYFGHRIGVVEAYSSLKLMYCLPSGWYQVFAEYSGLIEKDSFATIQSNTVKLNIP